MKQITPNTIDEIGIEQNSEIEYIQQCNKIERTEIGRINKIQQTNQQLEMK